MKRFSFRLEKVLQYRTLIKDEKLRELLLRNYELQQVEKRIEGLEHDFLSNEIEQSRVMQAAELQQRGAYAARLMDELVSAKLEKIEAEKKVEEAMQLYVEASKDQRALAMLKDRKRSEYNEWIEKEIGKDLDEMSIQRAGFQRSKRLDLELEDKE